MAAYKASWRGLHTEGDMNRLPGGTADTALNVCINRTSLAGRLGFGEFCATPPAAGHAILNLTCAEFSNGQVHLVCKCSDGFLYRMQLHPTAGTAWTKITDLWGGHNTLDAGTFFFWADRLHYGDRVGWTRWFPVSIDANLAAYAVGTTYDKGDEARYSGVNYRSTQPSNKGHTPSSTSAWWTTGIWKDGIQSNTGAIMEPAAGGQLDGWYRAVVTKCNSVTEEESNISGPQAEAVESRIAHGRGGLSIANASTILAADASYEWDKIRIYRSMGQTEKIQGQQCFSYRYYIDAEVPRTATSAGLNKADKVLQYHGVFQNAGAVPPACRHACYDGSRAVYADIYLALSAIPGQIQTSLPGYPTMVPIPVTYVAGTPTVDSTTVVPKPWSGIMGIGAAGMITGIGAVGGRFLVYTQNSVTYLARMSDGRLMAQPSGAPGGCLSEHGVVTGRLGIHAIGKSVWLLATSQGIGNLAKDNFTPTLDAIPAAYANQTVGAAYGLRQEVWMAVSRGLPYDCDYVKVICTAGRSDIAATAALSSMKHDYQLYPDSGSAAANDAAYFGWTAKPSAVELNLLVSRQAAYTGDDVLTWEYSKTGPTWATWTPTDDTTHPTIRDGGVSFEDDGAITGVSPSDWTSVTVASQAAYWLRARITDAAAAAKLGVPPILRNPGATRILIFDEGRGELVSMYDPRNLGGAKIQAMWEVRSPSHTPRMMLGLSDGRTLYWPTALYTDGDSEGEFDYPTCWQGYFLQERRETDMRLDRVSFLMGATDTDHGVTVGMSGVPTAQKSGVTDSQLTANLTNDRDIRGAEFYGNLSGNLFRAKFSTTVLGSAEWTVNDMILEVAPEQRDA
jgi:hypothetical protein